MQYVTPTFTALSAKAYLLECFKYQQELRSYSHEVTDNGVFTKADIDKFDTDTLIAVATDCHYETYCSIASMCG